MRLEKKGGLGQRRTEGSREREDREAERDEEKERRCARSRGAVRAWRLWSGAEKKMEQGAQERGGIWVIA